MKYLAGGSKLTDEARARIEAKLAELRSVAFAPATSQARQDRLALIAKMLLTYPTANATAEAGRARAAAVETYRRRYGAIAGPMETWLGLRGIRTLHLRAMTDSVTEIWLALDHHRLPVKIRYTDKKGDIFEQVATEIGSQ